MGEPQPDAPDPGAERSAESGLPPLGKGWKAFAGVLAVAIVALMAGAFVNSYAAVRDAVEPAFGDLAWTLPLLIDCGIVVVTGLDLLLCRLHLRIWWLRAIPLSLIAATVYLNVIGETTTVGVVAHAVAPLLWVVPVELAAHVIRAGAGLDGEHARRQARRRARGRLDRVRLSRWLLAPVSTAVIRRQMVLHEESSYDVARCHWHNRQEAKWELQDTYGAVLWRLRAPRRARGLYRRGHLTAALVHHLHTQPSPHPAGERGSPASRSGAKPRRQPPARRPGNGARKTRTRTGDVDDLMGEVARIAARIEATGQRVTKRTLGAALREAGWQIGNDRVREALKLWRTQTPAQAAPASTGSPEVASAQLVGADGQVPAP